VTWTDRNAPFFYMQDSSGGMCITCAPGDLLNIYPGCNVGSMGTRHGPICTARQGDPGCQAERPVCRRRPITLERALTGGEEANWVAMSGYLRRISRQGMWNVLEVVTSAETSRRFWHRRRLNSLVGDSCGCRGLHRRNERRAQAHGHQLWFHP